MKSTLKSLFNSGIYPFEEIVPKDPEYRTINRQISEMEEYFSQRMTPDDAKKFERLAELYSRSISIYACDSFAYGFRLGVTLMGEAFVGEE